MIDFLGLNVCFFLSFSFLPNGGGVSVASDPFLPPPGGPGSVTPEVILPPCKSRRQPGPSDPLFRAAFRSTMLHFFPLFSPRLSNSPCPPLRPVCSDTKENSYASRRGFSGPSGSQFLGGPPPRNQPLLESPLNQNVKERIMKQI
jgi:hypothetical protein